eukprot:2185487-Rhodomonas_salina.2
MATRSRLGGEDVGLGLFGGGWRRREGGGGSSVWTARTDTAEKLASEGWRRGDAKGCVVGYRRASLGQSTGSAQSRRKCGSVGLLVLHDGCPIMARVAVSRCAPLADNLCFFMRSRYFSTQGVAMSARGP